MTETALPPPLSALAGGWSWVDVALVVFLAINALEGVRRGFIAGAIGLAGLFLTLYVAVQYFGPAASMIRERVALPVALANVAGFFVVLLVAQVVVALATRVILALLRPVMRLLGPVRLLDHVLGFLPGLIQGVLVAAMVLAPLHLFAVSGAIGQEIERSTLAPLVARGAANVAPQLQDFVEQVLGDTALFHSRVVDPDTTVRIEPQQGITADPASEAAMIGLVNQERMQRGLQPLVMDEELRAVAREHSAEMLRLGYFSHTSPVSGSPSDRLLLAGVRYLVSGENLAYAPTVEIAHEGLMQSAGHRENILTAEYTRVGIGVQNAGLFGRMFTQEFAG